MSEWRFNPIGVIRSPFDEPSNTPIQPVFAAGACGCVEVLQEYAEGLQDLEGFSHIYLVYVFHRVKGARLRVKPFLQDVEHGVFATRAPCRPSPVGLSIVRLVRREGAVLHVQDIDVVDGTPLLDIKPFVPRFDAREDASSGWLEEVDDRTAEVRGSIAGRDPAEM
ncbi:MAG: tRNA (N6-threonylcarbamoyladenosine(37)-N6)-methyltransferase TrmO [Planctomycetota bacterium]|jgi:tRNA-Thr(GGU) m(6)t(6)A37 methyltransferase TsaA